MTYRVARFQSGLCLLGVIRVDGAWDESPLVSRFQTLMCYWQIVSARPFAERSLWNIERPRPRSLRLDIRGLNDRPPFLDLRFVEGSEPLGRLLVGRSHIQSDFGKASAQGRVGERLRHRTVELCDDVLRSSLRGEQTEPTGQMETSQATLIGSWNVRHCRRALWREVRNRLNRATPHLGQCNSGLADHKVEDLPG